MSASVHGHLGPLEARIGGDEALHALADEGDGDLLVSLHDPAADHDPVAEAPVLDPVAGLPGRVLLGAERVAGAGRGERAASQVDVAPS